MSLSILIPDSLHINKKNFTSFHTFIEQQKIKVHIEDSHKDWIALYGVYNNKIDILEDKVEFLSKLTKNDLFNFKVNEINIFYICRAELLSLVSVQPIWYENSYPDSTEKIFYKLFENNRLDLLHNMAAAWYWVSFWKKKLADLPKFSHCCIFSGSLIYQRSLIELLKHTATKVMVMESLFTGNEYYCEERYSPIANNSDIKHNTIYKSHLKALEDKNLYDRERIKAINKFILSKNKNVEQPTNSVDISFKDMTKPIVTIVGQVINDFSVLEYKNLGLSTIDTYKKIIYQLASAGFNVVFKSHPWEEKKNNIKTALTKKIIESYINELPEDLKESIQVVDHYSIKKLFSQSKWIMGLNSQGLLEAAFEGFKPIQLGNAFYGNKGFTHDYHVNDLPKLIENMLNNSINPILTLTEFNDFEKFITVLLQKHTVSIHNSGLLNLRNIFALPNTIPLVTSANVKKISSPANLKKSNDLTKTNDTKNQKTQISAAPLQNNYAVATIKNTDINLVLNHKTHKRKLTKLKTNPRLFFSESKFAILRPLRHLFSYKELS
ncbi:capsular biosynthesis protein [Neisseria montereyensis]|uniref:Capsular biosynthesis protein n=1 Tax=Neisseria montereyensis TaxID=2973938 RepID=A0ABT2FEY8_9NEIS|nr:capsular biosynthesis protein [Neisseria montereyensis]MCS4534530.1 capsular biosynthesis protein [Neisseria montereyensis]